MNSSWAELYKILSNLGMHSETLETSQIRDKRFEAKDVTDAEFEEIKDEKQSNTNNQET